ncbi:hypothetical protein KUCAC02_034457, partial [Chaenocephalus aceratus]
DEHAILVVLAKVTVTSKMAPLLSFATPSSQICSSQDSFPRITLRLLYHALLCSPHPPEPSSPPPPLAPSPLVPSPLAPSPPCLLAASPPAAHIIFLLVTHFLLGIQGCTEDIPEVEQDTIQQDNLTIGECKDELMVAMGQLTLLLDSEGKCRNETDRDKVHG